MEQNQRLRNYVAGEFIATPHLFDDINPVDGSLVARVCEAHRTGPCLPNPWP
jgi:hypothetical protein